MTTTLDDQRADWPSITVPPSPKAQPVIGRDCYHTMLALFASGKIPEVEVTVVHGSTAVLTVDDRDNRLSFHPPKWDSEDRWAQATAGLDWWDDLAVSIRHAVGAARQNMLDGWGPLAAEASEAVGVTVEPVLDEDGGPLVGPNGGRLWQGVDGCMYRVFPDGGSEQEPF